MKTGSVRYILLYIPSHVRLLTNLVPYLDVLSDDIFVVKGEQKVFQGKRKVLFDMSQNVLTPASS